MGLSGSRTRWQRLAVSLGASPLDFFELVAHVDNKATDTQVNIYCNTRNRELVVCFRGTQAERRKDRLTDYRVFMRPFITLSGTQVGKVHSGFRAAYYSVRGVLKEVMQEIAEPGWNVLATGHSLGGALATLAAVEIGSEIGNGQVALYTAGCPRVGNQLFCEGVTRYVGEQWRLRNMLDLVGALPFTFTGLLGRYQHVYPGLQLSSLRSVRGRRLDNGCGITYNKRDGSFPEALLGDLAPLNPSLYVEEQLARRRGRFSLNVASHDLGVYLQNLTYLAQQLPEGQQSI